MKHILLGSVLIIVIATPLGALAQTPTYKTVDQLRNFVGRYPVYREVSWGAFASGAINGVNAAGWVCDPPAGAPLPVSGELEAHLRYAAAPTDEISLAIRKYLTARGCRSVQAEASDEEWLEAWKTGWSDGWKGLAKELLLVRIMEDHAVLEELVRRAGEPGADAVAQVIGLVAGARLLELSREQQKGGKKQ